MLQEVIWKLPFDDALLTCFLLLNFKWLFDSALCLAGNCTEI